MKIDDLELKSQPKYRLIQEWIRERIDSGELPQGSKLPAEHDMARSLGVAYMTVRNAVNELVNLGMLQRIQGKGTFVTTSSTPNAVGTLTLIVPSLPLLWSVVGVYYFPPIVQGFCAEATRLGYEPTVIGRAKDAFQPTSTEFAGLAGAACLLISDDDLNAIESLRDMKVETVGINTYGGRRSISYVAADQAEGMRQAVTKLVEAGHSRIAFLTGPENNLGAEERARGFRRAMTEHHLAPLPVHSESRDYTDTSGYLRAKQLLSQPHPPTAIVTAGDLIAAGVLQAAREMNFSVPDDLSVVGYGDFHLATHLQPTLTTVRLPLAELGAQAAQMLHRRISGDSKREKITLSTELVERESVAPPR
jgi:DNA-binding LacI/PurR family transcriptional regulator